MQSDVETKAKLVNGIRLAEHQFRLACIVHVAVTNEMQTLDAPIEWVFGKHRVSYEDFGLRPDQADWAAYQLEMTTMFVLVAAIRDAIVAEFRDPRNHANAEVVAAYQISRMIRNAFSHSMVYPKWSIDNDCKGRFFSIRDIISLDCSALHDKELDWRDYGGPLSIFYFSRFVRETLLDSPIDPNRIKPERPKVEYLQQGRLILRKIPGTY